MIVKTQKFEKDSIIPTTEQFIPDVERVTRYLDEKENLFLELRIKNKECKELIPITALDDKGNHPSLIQAVWLMNDEGKTIEKII